MLRVTTFLRYALLAAIVVSLPACDSGSDEPARISGTYSGRYTQGTGSLTAQFVLTESATGQVTGNGSFVGPGGSLAVTFDGTHVGNSFALAMRISGSNDANYAGTVDSDAAILTGTLTGSGFTGQTLVLSRVTTTANRGALRSEGVRTEIHGTMAEALGL